MSTTITDRLSAAATVADPVTDLIAVEALSGSGIAVRTGENTWALRTLTAPAAGITITNPAGVAGDPTLVLANDLAALEGLSSTGLVARTGTSAFSERTITSANAAISVANGSGAGGNPTLTLVPATQAEMEAGSSVILAVAPGRQQYHPSAAKCWAFVTVSAGTPTLQTNHNITSITDTATDQLTVTIATDFSSTSWCALMSIEAATTSLSATTTSLIGFVRNATIAAGSVVLQACEIDVGAATDPASWSFAGFGDQA